MCNWLSSQCLYIKLDRALILLGSALYLPSASVSLVFMMLYIIKLFCYILYFIF